jgi:spore germination cell wall hydrolase CwlJ-like protein
MAATSSDSPRSTMQVKLRAMHALKISPWPKFWAYAFVCTILALGVLALPFQRIAWDATSRQIPVNRAPGSAPPRPEPQLVRMLSREQAFATNQTRPISPGELQTALAFRFGDKLASPRAYQAAVACLAAAVYYEAAGEPEKGQEAVAQVVLNRVRHPAFPQTVCGVVYQGSDRASGCQFTFACDGSLARQPSPGAWERARRIAERALAGRVEASVGMATHYHANWVVPYWAPNLDKIAVVGSHIFYRWRGFWGQRKAFNRRYAGEVANPPQFAETSNLSAAWIDESAKPLGLPSAPDVLGRNAYATPGRRPLVADQSAPKLEADDATGRLVLDDSPSRPPDAKSFGLGL